MVDELELSGRVNLREERELGVGGAAFAECAAGVVGDAAYDSGPDDGAAAIDGGFEYLPLL